MDQRVNSTIDCILSHQMPELISQMDNIVNECADNFTRLKRFDLDCHHADGDEKCFVKSVLGVQSFGEWTDRQTQNIHLYT